MFKGLLITKDGNELFGELTIDKKAHFEEKKIDEVKYIITPTFFNAHTHLGDSIAKDPEFMELEKLVGPDGFKFKVLNRASKKELSLAMRNSINVALKSGTSFLADFREGEIEGVKLLKQADKKNVCVTFARPSNIEEAELLLKYNIDGFGMSSVRDHNLTFLEELRDFTRRERLMFAIHAGERDDEDVEDALALEPDLIIHMNKASIKNLKKAIDERIPIVSCLRSNAFFNLLNPKNYQILSEYERWLIGSDNVMISSPNMLSEMNFSSYLLKKEKEIFCAATRGFDVFRQGDSLIVFHTRRNLYKTKNLRSVVRRANTDDILKIVDKELVIE
ncbi:amidohydrolase [Archaeoglobales archaeon]|nr:MAG: amidohydrolase [Archaeoglobales archaeon]